MISDNPNVSLGTVDFSLYTRRIALEYDHHQKRMNMFAYTTVHFNYLETLTKIFVIPAEQYQFIHKKTFSTMLLFVGMLLQ